MNKRKRNIDRSCQFCLAKVSLNAKFCGKCGNQLEFVRTRLKRESSLNKLASMFETAFYKILKLTKSLGRIGKAAAMGFFLSLLITIVSLLTFSKVTNAATENLQIFSDIPLNHPVYQYCDYLINLKAIKAGPAAEFYPAKPISVDAWNSTMMVLKEKGQLAFIEDYLFSSSESINGEKIKSRIKSLAGKVDFHIDSRELDLVFEDISRLNVYCFLNQIFGFRRAN